MSDAELLDRLESTLLDRDPDRDILAARPDLTFEDVCRLQLALKRRQAEAGDPIVGYRVSLTNREAWMDGLWKKRAVFGDVTEANRHEVRPFFATLLQSHLGAESEPPVVPPGRSAFVEGEIGVRMRRDLEGPAVTAAAAREAIEGWYAAIDLDHGDRSGALSPQHDRALKAAPGDCTIYFGSQPAPAELDMRLEGMLVSVDGEPRASGLGAWILGDPINAVVWIANTLARHGEWLRADQLLVTGLCSRAPVALEPGDLRARAEFTRLGTVSVNMTF